MPKQPKQKITKVSPKAANPEATASWKENIPYGGGTSQWRDWAKSNPNRKEQAKKAITETNKSPTTMTKSGTPERKAMVKKWKAARPVSGKGKSKSDSEKAQRRNQMKDWAKWNPNRATNARRALKDK